MVNIDLIKYILSAFYTCMRIPINFGYFSVNLYDIAIGLMIGSLLIYVVVRLFR